MARILKNEGDRAMYINIPCEAEEDDPLFREVGDALGVELGKDNEWLKEFKKVYLTKEGSRVWNSLFQGHPTAAEGNIFKRAWMKYYPERLEFYDEYIQSWDCAFKDESDSDFVAGQVWGRRGADYYLLDRVKERMNLPETCHAIEQMSAKWPKTSAKLVEDKANGPAVIQILQTLIPGLIPINPDGGKVARANAVSPSFESGNVYLPDASIAPWVVEYVDELCAFPNGTNDDEVDATTQVLNRLMYYSNLGQEPQGPPQNHEEALQRRVQEQIKHLTNKKRGLTQI